MVDVSAKDETRREATAQAVLQTRPDVEERLVAGDLPKGEALAIARVAAISAAKLTSTLIPLCHPLPLDGVTVGFSFPDEQTVAIEATAKVTAKTGVEMEALTAVSAAALTIYDMCKAVDRTLRIDTIQLEEKLGGRSGHFVRERCVLPREASAPSAVKDETA